MNKHSIHVLAKDANRSYATSKGWTLISLLVSSEWLTVKLKSFKRK